MCPVQSVTYVSGRSKALGEIVSYFPVRSQSAFVGGVARGLCITMTANHLIGMFSSSVRFQSALVSGVAENCG